MACKKGREELLDSSSTGNGDEPGLSGDGSGELREKRGRAAWREERQAEGARGGQTWGEAEEIWDGVCPGTEKHLDRSRAAVRETVGTHDPRDDRFSRSRERVGHKRLPSGAVAGDKPHQCGYTAETRPESIRNQGGIVNEVDAYDSGGAHTATQPDSGADAL